LLSANPVKNIQVSVFTDDVGDFKKNKELTLKQAELLCKSICLNGVSSEKVLPMGYGETMNIAENETSTGREMNRRVTLRIK